VMHQMPQASSHAELQCINIALVCPHITFIILTVLGIQDLSYHSVQLLCLTDSGAKVSLLIALSVEREWPRGNVLKLSMICLRSRLLVCTGPT
jgi:hypothetical protein